MQLRTRPRVGDVAWLVRWCAEAAFREDSAELDYQRCLMGRKRCASREEALQVASEVYPLDARGFVTILPARFTAYEHHQRWPTVGYWHALAEEEIYEGED